MDSIRKIALIPAKWASKQLVHHWLLQFSANEQTADTVACVFCPELCRFSCPVAVVTGSDAVTPCNKNSVLYKEAKWPASQTSLGELWPIYACTGCGRCTEYCLHKVDVGKNLVAARTRFKWSKAREVVLQLSDQLDLWGDLAFELGETAIGQKRLEVQLNNAGYHADGTRKVEVFEPKIAYVLKELGIKSDLIFDWERLDWRKLEGKRWYLHESVFFSRRLARFEEVNRFIEAAKKRGIELVIDFEHGKDCIDCGGEGAYRYLFERESKQMAREIWEKVRSRCDGVIGFGDRCLSHFRLSVGLRSDQCFDILSQESLDKL